MFTLLFRNRRFALGWAALTLSGVAIFAGEDGGADRLAKSAEQVRAQRQMLERQALHKPAPLSMPVSDVPVEGDQPLLWAVLGSSADPENPRIGDVFFDPISGKRVRAVSRTDAPQPALPQ